MKINEEYNYIVLANDIDKVFLAKFSEYPIIDDNLSYNDLRAKLEFHTAKRIVFNNTFYGLRDKEKIEIINLLKKQNIKFILITSNVEDTLYADYIMVYDGKNIILEGLKNIVLKEEKLLKKVGYGLPFVVDLAIQLSYYDIFSKIYFDMDELVDDLWN